MRGCLLHGQSTRSLLPIVFILIAAGTAVIMVGLFIFGRVERYAKRTGRLKRSG
jgi:ABC-2 type transport system permease protein